MNQKSHTHSQTLHRARTIKTKMNTKTVTANSIRKEKKNKRLKVKLFIKWIALYCEDLQFTRELKKNHKHIHTESSKHPYYT